MIDDALRMAPATRRKLLDVAKGLRPADLWLRGARWLNVFSGRIEHTDLSIADGRFAALGAPPAGALQQADLQGTILIPGLIEPHSHSGMLVSPSASAPALLAHGTTTLFEDTLPYLWDLGVEGFWPYVSALPRWPRRFWLTRLRPSTRADDYPSVEELEPILSGPTSAGIMETTLWRELLQAPMDIFERLGRPLPGTVDGHAAGASPRALQQLALTGIRSCHEATTAEEAFERLRLGLYTVLRGSSLRPDLKDLCRIATQMGVPTDRLLLTTDGLTPADLENGHLNRLLRDAIASGLPPITAIRMATLQPATYYGVDQHLGAIAPGRLADVVAVEDLQSLRIVAVYAAGQQVSGPNPAVHQTEAPPYPVFQSSPAPLVEAAIAAPTRHEMVLESAAITRWRAGPGPQVDLSLTFEHGFVKARGFGFGAPGGIATSFTLARGELLVGCNQDDLRLASTALRQMGGGIALAHEGQLRFALPLPQGGMMSEQPLAQMARAARDFDDQWHTLGYVHQDPFYTLLFLTGDFLPDARLTRHGLFDVKSGRVLERPTPA